MAAALERVDNHAGRAVELLSLFGAAWALVHRRWAVVASGAAAWRKSSSSWP
ncbi:MAG TPA: hypothetical protein VI122_22370 [Thermoleophilaceae bacterium]